MASHQELTTEVIIRHAERKVVVELKMLDFTKAFFTSVMIFTKVTHVSQNNVHTVTLNFTQTGPQMEKVQTEIHLHS